MVRSSVHLETADQGIVQLSICVQSFLASTAGANKARFTFSTTTWFYSGMSPWSIGWPIAFCESHTETHSLCFAKGVFVNYAASRIEARDRTNE